MRPFTAFRILGFFAALTLVLLSTALPGYAQEDKVRFDMRPATVEKDPLARNERVYVISSSSRISSATIALLGQLCTLEGINEGGLVRLCELRREYEQVKLAYMEHPNRHTVTDDDAQKQQALAALREHYQQKIRQAILTYSTKHGVVYREIANSPGNGTSPEEAGLLALLE